MRITTLSMAIGLLAANGGIGGDCCAAPTGCDATACDQAADYGCGCQKTCKVVCEMKKVKRTVWVVECEEFCAPLPACGRGRCPRAGCGETGAVGCGTEGCDHCGVDACESMRHRCLVPPQCGKPRLRKKLVKKEITCEVPVYKCVVTGCGNGCGEASWNDGREAAPAEAPLAVEATMELAPLPPVVGTSYLKLLPTGP